MLSTKLMMDLGLSVMGRAIRSLCLKYSLRNSKAVIREIAMPRRIIALWKDALLE